MHMVTATRAFAMASIVALLSACNSSNPGGDLTASSDKLASPPSSVTAPVAPLEGLEAEYCPTVTLLEGTAILTKKVGNEIDYVAAISDTSRDCRIVDGKLRMQVGIAGRVTPGPVAQDRAVKLPIRVAIRRGTDVVYSKLGQQSVQISKNNGVQVFTYVDATISLEQPRQRNLTVLAGFDEGAPE